MPTGKAEAIYWNIARARDGLRSRHSTSTWAPAARNKTVKQLAGHRGAISTHKIVTPASAAYSGTYSLLRFCSVSEKKLLARELLTDKQLVEVWIHQEIEATPMIVAAGLGILVVVCLLLSMVQTPPHIGR